jgi:hypothetical protein
MQIIDAFAQGSDEWHAFRLGKITGTRLGTIWSARQYTKSDIENLLGERGLDKEQLRILTGKKTPLKADLEALLTEDDRAILSSDGAKKLEYYQVLADQVAIAPDDETFEDGRSYYGAMERGTGEEDDAAAAFTAYSGKELMVVACCVSDVDPRIINSPDRLVKPAEGDAITEAVEIKHLSSAKHLMAFFERRIPDDYWTQNVQYFVVNEKLERLYWVFRDPRIPMLPMFVLTVEREDLGHWPETMLKYQLRTLKELDDLTVRLLNESNNIMLPARAEKV